MQQKQTFIRVLSNIEQAFTISNEHHPLCVVCVLHLMSWPEIDEIKFALKQLQLRHILLQVGISKVKGNFYFQKLNPVLPIDLKTEQRTDRNTWRGIAEDALNTNFDERGPLMKCYYLPDREKTTCELVISFHHAIIDGISARLILHELLSLLGGVSLPKPFTSNAIPEFPAGYRKANFVKRLLAFLGRQLVEEWSYKKNGISSPIPENSKNACISFNISPKLSRQLSLRIGREGLSLNSVLLATITQVVLKHHHKNHRNKNTRLIRMISFADLRSLMDPPVSEEELGCYISMLRFSIPYAQDQSVFQFAATIRKAIFKARRNGEIFMMSKLSKYLIRMALKLQTMRLGVSALSFIGKLDLEPQYGSIRLHHVNAFITNNRFGPEFSAFGKLLFGSIGLDFTYLTSEMNADKAEIIVKEIKDTLEKMANFP